MNSRLLARVIRCLDHTGIDAYVFGVVSIYAKRCARLFANLTLGLRCFNHVLSACRLLVRAHGHLAALDDHMHAGPLSIVGTRVVAHNDRAIWTNDQCRPVSHTQACPAVGSGLYGIAGIELGIAGGGESFTGGGSGNAHLALERAETSTSRKMRVCPDIPERISVFPHIQGCPCGQAAKQEYRYNDVDGSFLNNPPFKSEPSSCTHRLLGNPGCGRGRLQGA
jgi:hypothetical protein